MAIVIAGLPRDDTLDSQARRTILGGSRSLGTARSTALRSTPSAAWSHAVGPADSARTLPDGTNRLPLLAFVKST